jgi:hypothetical protein
LVLVALWNVERELILVVSAGWRANGRLKPNIPEAVDEYRDKSMFGELSW